MSHIAELRPGDAGDVSRCRTRPTAVDFGGQWDDSMRSAVVFGDPGLQFALKWLLPCLWLQPSLGWCSSRFASQWLETAVKIASSRWRRWRWWGWNRTKVYSIVQALALEYKCSTGKYVVQTLQHVVLGTNSSKFCSNYWELRTTLSKLCSTK